MLTTTIVTGASSGIGRAAATALADTGRSLLLASRGETARERIVAEVRARGGRAEGFALDIASPTDLQALAERALESDGRLELIESAGTVHVHDLLEPDDYDRMFAEHYLGPLRLFRALLPAMLERGGATVHVASAAGLRAFPGTGAYVAAKHALLGHVRAAALELERTRAQVAAVCPYYVATPMMETGIDGLAAEQSISRSAARAEFGSRNPGGRWIEPAEVATAITDLLLPGANGRILVLDGGQPRLPDPALGE
ncbi:MAG: SDR family oxidoreductase [Planctomycetota bacterium]